MPSLDESLKVICSTLIASIGLGGATIALAQEEIEEIMVTGQKRERPLQETPLAISVIGGDLLEKSRVDDTSDLLLRVPGLGYSQPFKSYTPIAIRGASTQDDSIGVEPNVAVFIDEVFIGSTTSIEFDLLDLERVEILKGPQGTIFGRNTNGGLIHYITRTPDEEFRAKFAMTLGNYDRYEVGGYVSGEIKDGVYGSAVMRTRNTSGYVTNLVTGNSLGQEKVSSARFKLRFVPNDRTDIVLSADGSSDQSYGTPRYFEGPRPGLLDADSPFSNSMKDVAQDLDGSYDRVGYGVAAKIKYETDWGTIHSITSYRDFNGELFNFDFDAVNGRTTDGRDTTEAFPYQQTLLSAFTQEFRVDWSVGDNVNVISGLFYLDENQYRLEELAASGIPGSSFFGGDDLERDILDQEMDSTQVAFFTEAAFSLGDKWTLTLGGRWSEDEKDGSTECHQIGPFWCQATYRTSYSESWSEPSYRAILDVQANDDIMLYTSYSRGYKTGGFSNSASGDDPDPAVVAGLLAIPYRPEFSDSYELGARMTLMGGRMILNPTVFHVEYTDIQFLFFTGVGFISGNIGSGENTGLEVDFSMAATDNLEIWASYAHNDSEYGANTESFGVVAEGNQLQLTPENALTFGFDYEQPLSNGRAFSISADAVQNSRTWHDGSNDITSSHKVERLVNLRVGFRPSERTEIAVWANNLFDERYVVGNNGGLDGYVYSDAELAAAPPEAFYPDGSLGLWRTYTTPRTYGATLTLNFD